MKGINPQHPAEIYVRDVIAGHIPACSQVRLACERHVRDLKIGGKRGLRFEPAAAAHALDFFFFLKHSKGEWAGQSFVPEPWQQFIVYSLFGWLRADGLRRFRKAYIEVPRKNGKSTLLAGIGLYLFFADEEPGAEVYCAATKKDQAKIVFSEAENMRKASPSLAKRIKSFRNNMNVPETGSKFEPLGSDEDTLDGLNVHAALVDELHAHRDRKLWDVLDTASGARRQPMMFAITTAGFNRQSICWIEHEYAEKVLEQTFDDDSVFAFISCIEPDDDWESEKTWAKANPNFGVSVYPDDMRRQAHKAKNDPSAVNSFLRLRLNRWTEQDKRWMPVDKWNECVGYSLEGIDSKVLRDRVIGEMGRRPCIGALDLSSTIDITAWVKLFLPTETDPRFIVIPDFFMPKDRVAERDKHDRVPYDVWIREGFVTPTEGSVVDYDVVRAKVAADKDRFELREVAFDPWNATETASKLIEKGIVMVEFRQGFASMSEPTKRLMELVLSKTFAHLANPVLRWMASNLVVREDEAGNLKPNKAKSGEKIDGIVAIIMALGRAIGTPAPLASTYETRGLLIV